MGSTRLPGKSMMNLAGEPLVFRIIERVKRCRKIDQIVMAIPDTPENTVISELAVNSNISVYAGHEFDLLERYYQASIFSGADVIARLPADNPVPEPSEFDKIIEHHLSLGRRGFSSNLAELNNSGYPDGIGVEVFDFTLLSEARNNSPSDQQREHVHLNFFDYTQNKAVNELWCPISTIACPKDFRRPDLILDVNTEKQYLYMSRLYDALYPANSNFHITDIIKWHDNIESANGYV